MYKDEEQIEDEKERKRLEKMSIEELKVELDERMKASLIEEIQKLPERISNHLDEAAWHIICRAMGVKKDSWHDSKWEIDSHNEKTALAVALGDHALKQVKLAIPDFVEGLVVGDPRIPPIKTAYTKAYKEKLSELVHHKLWEVAHANAQKRFVEIIEEIGGEKVDPADLEEEGEEKAEESDDEGADETDEEKVEEDAA